MTPEVVGLIVNYQFEFWFAPLGVLFAVYMIRLTIFN